MRLRKRKRGAIGFPERFGQWGCGALVTLALLGGFFLLGRPLSGPTAEATSTELPLVVAECIAGQNHGEITASGPDSVEVRIENGRGRLLSHFLILRDQGVTRIEQRKTPLGGLFLSWENCL